MRVLKKNKPLVLWTAAGAAVLLPLALLLIYWRSHNVVACVARYAKPQLTPADIRKFVQQGRLDCFVRDNPFRLAKQAEHLPISLGIDARNGKVVEVAYHCSDVCPGQGGTFVRYRNVAENDCCASGGLPMKNWVGGYLGCAPAVEALGRFYFPRRPGGPTELATEVSCHPTKVKFDDGTVITLPSANSR
jgi:hypothetical protein